MPTKAPILPVMTESVSPDGVALIPCSMDDFDGALPISIPVKDD